MIAYLQSDMIDLILHSSFSTVLLVYPT